MTLSLIKVELTHHNQYFVGSHDFSAFNLHYALDLEGQNHRVVPMFVATYVKNNVNMF